MPFFHKGGNFCDFLTVFLHTEPFLKSFYSKRTEWAPLLPKGAHSFLLEQIYLQKRTDVPPLWIFSFPIAVKLLLKSKSPISNQLFVMSKLYIHENLVRIQPLVLKKLCRQEKVMLTPTASTSKSICPPPHKWWDKFNRVASPESVFIPLKLHISWPG